MLPLEEAQDEAEVRARAIAAAGKVKSGTGDMAARHHDYLAEAFGN